MNKSYMVELLKNYSFYKSRRILLEKEISIKRDSDNPDKENDTDLIKKLETELSQLKHKIDTIEISLKMTGDFDERYKIIIELHFFKNIRIEDIADMTHMSRSRCYELCNEAVTYMTRIVFGENQNGMSFFL